MPARRQDEFKLRTLEAMARGGSVGADEYSDGGQRITGIGQQALDAQARDAAAVNAPPGLAQQIAGSINVDPVATYMAEMAKAQQNWAGQTGSAYQSMVDSTPPPAAFIRPSNGGGGSGGGLSDSDLAIAPQVFPAEHGGGLRYGGFRTAGEYHTAVRGRAEQDQARRGQASETVGRVLGQTGGMLAGLARAGQDVRHMGERQAVQQRAQRELTAASMTEREEALGRNYAASMQARLRDAEQARQLQADIVASDPWRLDRRAPAARQAQQDLAGAEESVRALRGSMTDHGIPFDVEDPIDVAARAAARTADIERRRAGAGQPHGPARMIDPAAVAERWSATGRAMVPQVEDWEAQRRTAVDTFGGNPWDAAGRFVPPTPAQLNAEIRAEWELEQRTLDPEGLLPSERNAAVDAGLITEMGRDAYNEMRMLGIEPDLYLQLQADPVYLAAEEEAAQLYTEEGLSPNDIERVLLDDYSGMLMPEQMRMILARYRTLGVNENAHSMAFYDMIGR